MENIEEEKKKDQVVGSKEIAKIPKLEGQINYLKSILKKQQEDEDRKKELLKKIDPNVNLLINTRFDMTLNEVKAELSKKIKARESQMQRQLQDDLEARKKNFELQYKTLEENFEKRATDRPIDKEAALELAQTNSVLRNDDFTLQALRDGGYTVDGKFTPITHFDDFLNDREKKLRAKQQDSQGGPKFKPEHLVQHSNPNEKVE